MTNFSLSNSTYDLLKRVVQLWLPASGTLYFTISEIWNLPAGVQVVGTIAAVSTFLGIVLGVSTKNYEAPEAITDGALMVNDSDPLQESYKLVMNIPLDELREKKQIVINVEKDSQEKHVL